MTITTEYDTNNTMPFLYFVVRPKCQNSNFVYAKFGNTLNFTKRSKDYGPACKFASVEYDSRVSGNTPLDNYINSNVLHKNGFTSVVDFWQNDRSVRKTDWFSMQTGSADSVLSYMENVKLLYNNEDYRQFTIHLLGNILGRIKEKHTQNPSTIQTNLSSTNVKTAAQCYLKAYFKRGGMCPLKRISRHPEWKPAYKDEIETKKLNICKSCEQRWINGCCESYSRTNRTIWVMVIGWHE